MCKVEFYEGTKTGLELLDIKSNWSGSSRRTVGTHKRTAKSKTYVNPRIVLPNKFGMDDIIGRVYEVYKGRAKVTEYKHHYMSDIELVEVEGDCVILFFKDD